MATTTEAELRADPQAWRTVWRDGVAPALSTAGLTALRDALAGDDPRLIQGHTTSPPPLECVRDWPCEGGCAISYPGMVGDRLATVGEVEEHFAKTCFEADERIGFPAAVRLFLRWFDDLPRAEVRRELLAEVELALVGRAATPEATS